MSKFIKLKVFSKERGGAVETYINTDYIRQIYPDTMQVRMKDSKAAMVITEESMNTLVQAITREESRGEVKHAWMSIFNKK